MSENGFVSLPVLMFFCLFGWFFLLHKDKVQRAWYQIIRSLQRETLFLNTCIIISHVTGNPGALKNHQAAREGSSLLHYIFRNLHLKLIKYFGSNELIREPVFMTWTFFVSSEVLLDPCRTWCPSSTCQAVCQLKEADSPALPQLVQCAVCALEFCSACKANWHPGQACQENNLPITSFLPGENRCCFLLVSTH